MTSAANQDRLADLERRLKEAPHNTLAVCKEWYADAERDLGPEEAHELFALYRVLTAAASPEKPILVLMIHGIRTQAEWSGRVARLLRTPFCEVKAIKYGYFNAIRFLFPPTRRYAVQYVLDQIREAQADHPNTVRVVIAHSFGSYCIARILKKATDVRCDRLLLCGSVVPPTFQWRTLPNKPSIINDCGCQDIWPILAMGSTVGFGPSGTFGFGQSTNVQDRFHDCKHSDYFDDDFVTRYWVPWAHSGHVVDSEFEMQRGTTKGWVQFWYFARPLYIAALAILGFAWYFGAFAFLWRLIPGK